MDNVIVAGIGTDVGKTVTSAILATALESDYWKPLETGSDHQKDSYVIRTLLNPKRTIHSPAYSLKTPVSPYQASIMENKIIEIDQIILPQTRNSLVIEGIGGVLVPITEQLLSMELFMRWNARWILVVRNYLGCINHTLLTVHLLQTYNINLIGMIYNGPPDCILERILEKQTKLPILAKISLEKIMDRTTVQRYAEQWKNKWLL